VTLRDRLEGLLTRTRSAEKQAELEEELEVPPFPDGVGYLWEWFMDLSRSRPSTGFGPAGITYSEIQAWAALKRVNVAAWEVDILRALDAVFLGCIAEVRADSDGR
tara:strand:+ start:460 stop:777 length:318 start_codon:yes stop_codon:yes gene_type:complete